MLDHNNKLNHIHTMAIKDETLEDRFYRNVNVGRDDECWIWHGNRNSAGYGQMTWHKRKYVAHRLAYELHRGPITERNVCHTCDVRGCCNPRHLFQASQSENMKDAFIKKRLPLALKNAELAKEKKEAKARVYAEREARFAAGRPTAHDLSSMRMKQGLRDHLGRRISQSQTLPPRERDSMGHFI